MEAENAEELRHDDERAVPCVFFCFGPAELLLAHELPDFSEARVEEQCRSAGEAEER